jgi:hypothetical protein
MKKIITYIIWLALILIGAFTHKYLPDGLEYLYGFIFGTFSLVALDIATHI